MATDYSNFPKQKTTSPAAYFASVTPADSALPNGPCRGIYVGGSGNLAILTPDAQTITFTGIATGVIHPISAVQIKAATTATLIIACY